MALPKCMVPVVRDNYNVQEGKAVISTQLDGGKSRYRADQLQTTALIIVNWVVGKADYDYLQAFYRTAIVYGSLPFLIDLVWESALPIEYVAQIQPQTWKLNSVMGDTYTIEATLEVVPQPIDPANDALLLARNS